MPGLEELLAMRGGGGGAPMPPMQGQDAGGMAGALQAKLAELMQDPVAVRGMRDFMQQQGGGMGAPGAAQAPPTGGPMDMTGGIPPGMEAPPGAPPDAEAMAMDAIDTAGGWEGTDAPTQSDIERLQDDPSQPNIDSFNQQFGEGAAEEVLGGGGEAEGDAPPEEASEY
jgi:hypothetical protein